MLLTELVQVFQIEVLTLLDIVRTIDGDFKVLVESPFPCRDVLNLPYPQIVFRYRICGAIVKFDVFNAFQHEADICECHCIAA